MITDFVPIGTFFSLEPERFAAMKAGHRLGKRLALEHPELAEIYRDINRPFQAMGLGKTLLPLEAARSEGVVKVAVLHALKLLIPSEELSQLTYLRREKAIRDKWDFSSPEWSEHCKRAGKRRHSLGLGVDVKAMLDGRNRTEWSKEEKLLLFSMATGGEYLNPKGIGGPDYIRISEILNKHFHHGKKVRFENSCRSMVADIRRKKTK